MRSPLTRQCLTSSSATWATSGWSEARRRLAGDGASGTEIQALPGHESLNTSQGYIDATASRTRQAARANRTYRTLQQLVFSTN